MDYEAILTEALAAAETAAEVQNSVLPEENLRGFDCGFAWVNIKPARGKFITFLKKKDLGETKHYDGGGFEIWYSKLHSQPTQSQSVHVAACHAFVEVLIKHGINRSHRLSVDSRSD